MEGVIQEDGRSHTRAWKESYRRGSMERSNQVYSVLDQEIATVVIASI